MSSAVLMSIASTSRVLASPRLRGAAVLWLPYLLALVLALVGAYAQAQSVGCQDIGGRVLVGPGAGSLTHSIDWRTDACASEAAILLADSGFVWANCSVSGAVMTGDVRDTYGATIFAGRQWERLPVGCTAGTTTPPDPDPGTGGSSTSVTLDVSAIPLLSLSVEDAQTVGYGIWAVWAAAWALSVLRRALPFLREESDD